MPTTFYLSALNLLFPGPYWNKDGFPHPHTCQINSQRSRAIKIHDKSRGFHLTETCWHCVIQQYFHTSGQGSSRPSLKDRVNRKYLRDLQLPCPHGAVEMWFVSSADGLLGIVTVYWCGATFPQIPRAGLLWQQQQPWWAGWPPTLVLAVLCTWRRGYLVLLKISLKEFQCRMQSI